MGIPLGSDTSDQAPVEQQDGEPQCGAAGAPGRPPGPGSAAGDVTMFCLMFDDQRVTIRYFNVAIEEKWLIEFDDLPFT